jgi:O-antigen/teichoic acid export membrane protein
MLPTRILILGCSVLISAVIARELGPSGRGAVAVAFGLALVLMQCGTVGITAANPYFVAREPEVHARLVSNSVLLAAVLGALTALMGIAVRLIAPQALDGVAWVDLAIALSAIPATLLAQFLQSILLGEGRTRAYNAIELAVTVLTLLALILVTTTSELTVQGALLLLAAGRFAAAAAFLATTARGSRLVRPDIALARRMAGYGLRVYAATLLAYLVIRIDLLLVNAYEGPQQAGYYAVAVALADALYILPTVVALNLFAHVARGTDEVTSAHVFRSVAVVYLFVCTIAAVAAGPIIQLVYGPQFNDATVLFWWLAPGIFCLGMLSILSQHFAGRGFPLPAVLVWVVGLGLNLAMNIVLLPIAGTQMAALSASVTYILLLFLHVRMFARSSGGYGVLRPRLDEVTTLARAALARVRTAPLA